MWDSGIVNTLIADGLLVLSCLQPRPQALDKRGKDLSELEKKTMQFADDAADFGSMATKLAEKYR